MKYCEQRIALVSGREDTFIHLSKLAEIKEGRIFQIDWVLNYEEFFNLLLQQPIEALFLEYQFNEQENINFIHKVRLVNADLPIIVISEHADEKIEAHVLAAGASDYLFKEEITAFLLKRSIRYAKERIKIHKMLQENEAMFQQILDAIDDMILVKRAKSQIVWANKSFQNYYGMTNEQLRDLIDAPFNEPDFTQQYVRDDLYVFNTGETLHIPEEPVTRHDGVIGYFETVKSAIRDTSNNVVMTVGVSRDITERKQALELKRERESLKFAIKSFEQVLEVLGHELRTPLAALRANTELLLLENQGLSFEFQEYVRGTRDEIVRMAGVVNDLLEVARLNSGVVRWNWTTFSLTGACNHVVASVGPVVEKKQLSLCLEFSETQIFMKGDESAVGRLIINLLSNSIRHTREGGVALRLKSFQKSGEKWVKIEISDTGEGISKQISMRLGEAFALNAGVIGNNYIQGSGLGLAICKGIVAAHGGAMAITSAPGKGTTVIVELRVDLETPQQEIQNEKQISFTSDLYRKSVCPQ